MSPGQAAAIQANEAEFAVDLDQSYSRAVRACCAARILLRHQMQGDDTHLGSSAALCFSLLAQPDEPSVKTRRGEAASEPDKNELSGALAARIAAA